MQPVTDYPFPVIAPSTWSDIAVGAFMTTRSGGVSCGAYGSQEGDSGLNLGPAVGDDPAAVQKNQEILAQQLPAEPIWLHQIHGANVFRAGKVRPTSRPQADAAVTNQPQTVLAILTADCLPVLLVDPIAGVIGAAHGGWRGLAGGVLRHTVQAMVELGAHPAGMRAWLGAAIGPACFEVGPEVPDAFIRQDSLTTRCFTPHPETPGKWLGDLHGIARIQLAASGLTSVSGEPLCTVEDRRFYSFRRDRVCGRMGSFIWLG